MPVYSDGWLDEGAEYLRADLAAAKVAAVEDQLAQSDAALTAIRQITGLTHAGVPRAHAALSQIDQLARKGLGDE
jgi:hypothetical protein